MSVTVQRFLSDHQEPEGGKSEGDSRRLREAGNNLFKVGRDLEAIEMFNRAIMKAPVNDEKKGRDMSLGLANRSAALMRLGHSRLALEDVDLALNSGYPKDLRYRKEIFRIFPHRFSIEGSNCSIER